MVDVQGEMVIDRRPEDLFDFAADEENEPRYNLRMRLAKKVTEGPIGVGTTFKAEMTGRGRVVPMTITFTEFDRPRLLTERVQMSTMDLTGGLTFEPVDGGTKMRWSWTLRPRGVLRFMGPVVAALGRRQERRIWTSLKQLLEDEDSVAAHPSGMSPTSTSMTAPRQGSARLGVRATAGGVAALLAASLLLVGIAALVLGLPRLELRTWLVVLFQINAGIGTLPPDPLRVFNPLDVMMLVLAAAAILGIWRVLPRVKRVWLYLGVGLPLAGIVLLLATHNAGRSSLMGAGFVASLFMLRDADLRRVGVLGALANALLFVGDLGTGDSTRPLVAIILAVGYLLLLAWFGMVAVRLLGSSGRARSEAPRAA